MPGETDGRNGLAGKASGLKSFANGEGGGAPPVARILLGPAGFRDGEVGMFFVTGSEDGATVIENDGACAAGSDIYAQDWNEPSSNLAKAKRGSVNVHDGPFKTTATRLVNDGGWHYETAMRRRA